MDQGDGVMKPETRKATAGDTGAPVGEGSPMAVPRRKLRDYYAPPIELPAAASIPDAEVGAELDRCLALLADHRIGVDHCDHLTKRQLLEVIAKHLEAEADPPPPEGHVVLEARLFCPECDRTWLAEALDGPPS